MGINFNFRNIGKVKCDKCDEYVSLFSINTLTIGDNTRSYRLCDRCLKEVESWINSPAYHTPVVVINSTSEGNYIPTEIK